MSLIATNLGYPRIGAHRELKKALESHWAGHLSAGALRRAILRWREACKIGRPAWICPRSR